ncbi:hypothetical protein EDC18_101313 [Natranaerovirga pectinivora]|uniref:Uncharacterized protein n=1 Tax=Natranaerovirga pectinivora TaxID=682400 RepID=A0A4R3MP09_9FIRM|nr:hypothetical protein [Natranaerovirga pectinivora]TCT17017.1 hypothetical protein EDC18_101313 [Natranaerovirga pectinivora]
MNLIILAKNKIKLICLTILTIMPIYLLLIIKVQPSLISSLLLIIYFIELIILINSYFEVFYFKLKQGKPYKEYALIGSFYPIICGVLYATHLFYGYIILSRGFNAIHLNILVISLFLLINYKNKNLIIYNRCIFYDGIYIEKNNIEYIDKIYQTIRITLKDSAKIYIKCYNNVNNVLEDMAGINESYSYNRLFKESLSLKFKLNKK